VRCLGKTPNRQRPDRNARCTDLLHAIRLSGGIALYPAGRLIHVNIPSGSMANMSYAS
jgi:hypothetical protein